MFELDTIHSQFLYITIYVISVFFAFRSQRKESIVVGYDVVKFNIISYVISFIIPCFFICFTNIGSDYESYYAIIQKLTWDNYASFYSEEPGINIFFLIIRTIALENIDVSIFLIKTINLLLIFFSFYVARGKLKIGYSVFAYLLLLYLPSFYLISIALAFGLCFLAISIYLTKGSRFWASLIIFLAAQLHNSAYLFLMSFLACLLLEIKNFSKIVRFLLFVAYFFAVALSSKIYTLAQSLSGFHYNNYADNLFVGSGIMVPVLYIPIFLFVYYVFKFSTNIRLKNCLLIFSLSSCLFNILSYQFRVIERMEFYYVAIFCLLMPQFLFETGADYCVKDGRKQCSFVGFLITLYVLFRGYIVLIERTTVHSGVGNYTFFNPFG